jgi:prepilin-type N-terminal cleavage/methylation domain-containing protein
VRRAVDGGFTLLEVMVALAVLAGSLMAVAELSGNALRNYAYSRDLSVATLLARAKIAELAEKYDDLGFTDFDQKEEGTFADQGQPGVRWALELRKPTSELTAERILAAFLGGGADGSAPAQELLGKLLGGGAAGGAAGASPSGPGAGMPGGVLGGVLQGQVKAFAEELKSGVRQVTLRVSWVDGKTAHGFDVNTWWVVLNPRAPGGARGQNPDVPANMSPPPGAGTITGPVPGLQPGLEDTPARRRRNRPAGGNL